MATGENCPYRIRKWAWLPAGEWFPGNFDKWYPVCLTPSTIFRGLAAAIMSVLRKRGPCSANRFRLPPPRGTSEHYSVFRQTGPMAGSDYLDFTADYHCVFKPLTLSQYCFMHVSTTLHREDMFS